MVGVSRPHPAEETMVMIAAGIESDRAAPGLVESSDPVVRRYRALFALLDWRAVPERDDRRRWPGQPPHPRAAYIKALLVKLCEQKVYVTDLRRYLVEHPALVVEVGFRPVTAAAEPWGFD